jgi:dephospho-CoA kinase
VIARTVFANPGARAKLEAFTHPPIRARIRAELQAAREAGVPVVVLDVPLLLENDAAHGLLAECDATVFVDADENLREARASASRGWRPGEVARREAAQMPLAAKKARAGRVIENRGDLSELEGSVETLARDLGLRRRASARPENER